MRTFDEVNVDIEAASRRNDYGAMMALADELTDMGTEDAMADGDRLRGVASGMARRFEEAVKYFQLSFERYVQNGMIDKSAQSLCNIGIVFDLKGDYEKAMEFFQKALEHGDQEYPTMLHATVLDNMGSTMASMGDYSKSLEYLRRSQHIHKTRGDGEGEAYVLLSIGETYRNMGLYPEALQNIKESFDLFERSDNQLGVAACLTSSGAVHLTMGNHSQAEADYDRALAIELSLTSPSSIAAIWDSQARLRSEQGLHDEALALYEQAFKKYDELGQQQHAVRVAGNLAGQLITMEQYDRAAEMLEFQENIGIASPMVNTWHFFYKGRLHHATGNDDEAEHALSQAIEIGTASGIRTELIMVHELLRDIARARGDLEGYIEHNTIASQIRESVNGRQTVERIAVYAKEQELAAIAAEREREKTVLYSTLPRHVADRVIRGETIEDHFETAAVLFADIVGFTTHTSSMHPSETIKLLEDLYQHFDAICAEHGVIKVKTIGDSYLCFAHEGSLARARDDNSSPSSRDSDVVIPSASEERIATVALKMLASVHTWPDGSPLQLRIGIHSGPLSAGVIGTQRLQYDIWGDTVNVASRMESTGEAGRVQCSEAFASVLSPSPSHLRERGAATRHPDGGEADEGPHEYEEPLRRGTVAPSNYHTVGRGTIEVKGKGLMQTYWLEGA